MADNGKMVGLDVQDALHWGQADGGTWLYVNCDPSWTAEDYERVAHEREAAYQRERQEAATQVAAFRAAHPIQTRCETSDAMLKELRSRFALAWDILRHGTDYYDY